MAFWGKLIRIFLTSIQQDLKMKRDGYLFYCSRGKPKVRRGERRGKQTPDTERTAASSTQCSHVESADDEAHRCLNQNKQTNKMAESIGYIKLRSYKIM